MSILPSWKKCPKCHKIYSWNPDIGRFTCPYCNGPDKTINRIFDKIFGKESKDDDNSG